MELCGGVVAFVNHFPVHPLPPDNLIPDERRAVLGHEVERVLGQRHILAYAIAVEEGSVEGLQRSQEAFQTSPVGYFAVYRLAVSFLHDDLVGVVLVEGTKNVACQYQAIQVFETCLQIAIRDNFDGVHDDQGLGLQ